MTNQDKRNVAVGVLIGALLTGGAAWWFWPHAGALPSDRPSASPAVANFPGGLKLNFANGKMDDKFLEDIQKQLIEQRVTEMRDYAKLSPDEKKKKLDQDIDAQEQVHKMMPNLDPTSMPADGKPSVEVQGTPTNQRVTVRIGGGGQKSAMENLPPDVRAVLQQYQKDIAARRAERGLPPSDGGRAIIRRGG